MTNFVHREGQQLLSPEGEPLFLRGTNFGGFLLWEGWIWGGAYAGESQIMKNLAALVGQIRADQFREDVRHSMYSQRDFQQVADAGFNVVRLPINHRLIASQVNGSAALMVREEGFRIIDRLLDFAQAEGVGVILDMHGAPGSQNRSAIISDFTGGDDLWAKNAQGEAHRANAIALWAEIARRYANHAAVWGYDLLNEPVNLFAPPMYADLMTRFISAIRDYDRNHMIWVEGNNVAHDFVKPPLSPVINADPLKLTGYEFHQYPWDLNEANNKAKLKTYIDAARVANCPIFCGECGLTVAGSVTKQMQWFDALPSPPFAGFTQWCWKKVGAWTPAVVNETPAQKKLINYICAPNANPKPTSVEAEAGMSELLTSFGKSSVDQQTLALYQ